MANLSGTSGNDTLVGTAGDDTLNGLGGNDTLIASGGTDFYDGGAGADTLDVRTASAGVSINFANGTIGGGFDGTFVSMERALGSNRADLLIGAAGGQNLSARGGNVSLYGGAGLVTLLGGGGADRFVFREAGTANADKISDFASGSDQIVLDGSVMSALGASGNFTAGDARFSANSSGTAQDASDRIIFNTTTRQLFYDADGNGSGAAALIATLQSGSTLAATDIAVENGGGGGGGGSGNTINGTAGNDTLVGTSGDDTINGLGGNDSLIGAAGRDFLNGGDGNDTLDGANSPFAGTDPDIDTLDGGLGDDRFIVDNAADVLSDAGGIDTVVAINIDWTLAAGFEHLIFRNETEIRQTGIGNDLDNDMSGVFVLLEGRGGDDTLFGAGGADAFGTPSILRGGEGNDLITGQGEGDLLEGGTGNDTIDGGPAAAMVNGGAGNDLLTGGDDADTFVFDVAPGAANADQVTDFTSGIDTIRLDGDAHANVGASGAFAAGDARFWSSATGTAHDPDDRVIYNNSTGQLWYDADGNGAGAAALIATLQGAPALAASDIEVVNGGSSGGGSGGNVINGTSANDTLSGTSGNDTINGLEGNDLFLAGSTGGNDVINGGAGRDSIEFKERATSPVTVDFVAGTITGGSSGTITFSSIERVLAGNFNDVLTGNAASQTLTGQGGSDTIWGAGGVDTLWGGTGGDSFVFREMGTANADRISDFATGADKLHLDDAAFTAIGPMGNFASGDGRFAANSSGTAQDAGDRVIFNSSTGALYYDADGSGAGAAPQLIATVQSGATVAATDIVVI